MSDNTIERSALAELYDRIYKILTYSPKTGEGTGLEGGAICVQMTQGEALDLGGFKGALSGSNPGGDVLAAEAFSTYVDRVPTGLAGAVWAPGEALASRYALLVNGANIDAKLLPSAAVEKTYKRLQGLLYAEVEKTSLVTQEVRRVRVDSPLFTAYKESKAAYAKALFDAADSLLVADLTTNEGKRKANLEKRRMDAEVEARYKDWVGAGKSDVDEVLDALESIKNNAVSAVIAEAKATMERSRWLASNSEGGQPWMLASATPSNWTEKECVGTKLVLKVDSLKTSTGSSATSYARQSRGWFWWGSEESSGESKTEEMGMESTALVLSAELVLVRIQRPWLNELLFTMGGWENNGFQGKQSISDGKGGGAGLPAIPIAFVMARNVQLKATFAATASSLFTKESRSGTRSGWGWGPFGGAGGAANDRSSGDEFRCEGNEVTISFAEPQVVAWINKFVPACPS